MLVETIHEAFRSIRLGPWSTGDPKLRELFGGRPASSGVSVNEDSALTFSAWWCAVSTIAADVAGLPLFLYKRLQDGDREEFVAHPNHRLVHDAPNPEMTSIVFRETLTAHVLTWGNGFAEIERDGAGRAVALWPLEPYRVAVQRDASRSLTYRVSNEGKPDSLLSAADMLHIPGLSFDGVTGYSVVAKARESIGLGLATERYGGTLFANGASFGGVISTPTMTETARERFNAQLQEKYIGANKVGKLLILEGAGFEFKPTTMPADDAQFLATRQHQTTEVARWFKIPPHKLMELDRATFSNIEHQEQQYLNGTLLPWLERWEQELNRKLIRPLERGIQYFEHSVEGRLRGDAAARGAFYQAMSNVGAITPNEIRRRENLKSLGPAGEKTYIQVNMQPLDMAGKPQPAPRPPAQDDPPPARSLDPEAFRAALLDEIAALPPREDLAPLRADLGALAASVALWPDQQRELLASLDGIVAGAATADEATRAALDGLRARLDAVPDVPAAIAEAERRIVETVSEKVDAVETATPDQIRAVVAPIAARVDEAMGTTEQLLADLADARAQAQAAQAELATERELRAKVATQKLGDIAEAAGKIVRAEVRDARRAAATPDKLLAWADEFYAKQADRWAAWLASPLRSSPDLIQAEGDPSAVAADEIEHHVEDSRADLAEAVAASSPAEALAALFTRWEIERAPAMVTRLTSASVPSTPTAPRARRSRRPIQVVVNHQTHINEGAVRTEVKPTINVDNPVVIEEGAVRVHAPVTIDEGAVQVPVTIPIRADAMTVKQRPMNKQILHDADGKIIQVRETPAAEDETR
jgi:HK97 family phage portal protein